MIDVLGVHLDLTITAGNILEIGVLACGGLFALSKFMTKFALFHADLHGVKLDVGGMKEEIKKVSDILARTNDNDRRIGRIEEIVYGLSRGEGFITGHRTRVDGEYPTPT